MAFSDFMSLNHSLSCLFLHPMVTSGDFGVDPYRVFKGLLKEACEGCIGFHQVCFWVSRDY